jgi:hypothetical protein
VPVAHGKKVKLTREVRDELRDNLLANLRLEMNRNVQIARTATWLVIILGVLCCVAVVSVLIKTHAPDMDGGDKLPYAVGFWSGILMGVLAFMSGIVTLALFGLSSISDCTSRCNEIELELTVANDTEKLSELIKGFKCFTKRPKITTHV